MYISGGYSEKLTNILLNKSAIFDHLCSQNDTLPTNIYNHTIINDDKIITEIHLIITIIADNSENKNVYIIKQINQNIISPKSVTLILVLTKKYRGLIGKLR